MSFESILGQERAKRMLQNSLRQNKLSHAYIFAGPSGSGRRAMALTLAQAIYCLDGKIDPCGVCLECRKVEHGNHPDLTFLEPDGSSIKIEQIRDLQKQFAYRSITSATKIYVIVEADKMTIPAANSLLKFLEEPHAGVIAILITDNGNALLPTIRSRSQWIPFVRLATQETIRLLCSEGFPPELVRSAVHLTANAESARELIGQNWFADARNIVIQLGKETMTRFPQVLITMQQKLMKSDLAEHLGTVLDLYILWFKDMVHLCCNRKENIVYIDQLDWLSKQAYTRDVGDWVRSMEHALEAQKRLRFHANPQLVMEKMAIDIQGG